MASLTLMRPTRDGYVTVQLRVNDNDKTSLSVPCAMDQPRHALSLLANAASRTCWDGGILAPGEDPIERRSICMVTDAPSGEIQIWEFLGPDSYDWRKTADFVATKL